MTHTLIQKGLGMNRTMFAGLLICCAGTLCTMAGAIAQPAPAAGNKPLPGMAAVGLAAGAKDTMDKNAPIPSDPSLHTGELPNGLKYVIKHCTNPPGRAAVWMHIDSGSLNETEKTRGIAHFLEHMAFNGSANFPPGSVVPFFQSLGLQFGRDQNAYTSFEETVYQLSLPDNKAETMDKALTFFSDVNGRMLLSVKEIDAERLVILEERRTRLGGGQRMNDYMIERLAPESIYGRRLPIGTEETIQTVTQDDFKQYCATYYVPSNTTVIVVGDVQAKDIVPIITKQFGEFKKVPTPKRAVVGIKPSDGYRAIIASDKEYKAGSVAFNRFLPVRPPTLTMGQYRSELVDTIGTWALNRRIAADLQKAPKGFRSASVSIGDTVQSATDISASASGSPEKWREMLTDLGEAVQRGRIHGFTEQEIEDARTTMIAGAETAVRQESSAEAGQFLRRINGSVLAKEPLPSASQRLEMLKATLPTINAKEVSEAFTKNFDPSAGLFILELPADAAKPTDAELIALGTKAFNVTPTKSAEEDRIPALMTKLPTPGKLGDVAVHADTQVTSGWLPNGARFHYRKADLNKEQASISIVLAAGEILETPAQRGLTSVAGLAFGGGGGGRRGGGGGGITAGGFTSTQIRNFMLGKKVNVGGGPSGDDAFTVAISGEPTHFETGLQLAHLALTDPNIEQTAFDRWKESAKQGNQQRKVTIGGILAETMADALYPANELRVRPLTDAQIDAISLDAARKWLRETIITAPMEISIVGDVDLAQVQPLVEKYLGSLPKRERINDKLYAAQRKIARPSGPIAVSRTLETQTDQAQVVSGFFGPDYTNLDDSRTLSMAQRIVSTRFVKTIREEKGLVYSMGARWNPSGAFPGYGTFVGTAPTKPTNAQALADAVDEVYDEFAKSGPTAEELTVAQGQLDKDIEKTMKEPGFWASRLAMMDYRGTKLDDVGTLRDFYKSLTPEKVKAVFAKYSKPESRFRVIVTPKDVAPEAPANDGGMK